MKTLHDLYLLLWEQIKDKEEIKSLCNEIHILYSPLIGKISQEEAKMLNNHFQSQKPSNTINSEFTLSNRWVGGVRWWSKDENNDPINRKAFIQKLLKDSKE